METEQQPEEGEEWLRPLHPNHVWVLRCRALFAAIALLIAGGALDTGPLREAPVPPGLGTAAAGLAALFLLLVLPGRRYRAWGYRMAEDELHIGYGIWTRVRTAVPFGRVQHIDVAQGPIQRRFGLGTLVLHTAGTRGAAVSLPGLALEDAERMRDAIRAKIKLDLV